MMLHKQAHYLQSIRTAYPSLHINSVDTIEGGQYNVILVINADTIFRFPRYDDALQPMSNEVHILQSIQGKLPLPVPNPIHVNLEGQAIGQAFMGYKMLPGELIDLTDIETQYDAPTCQRLADQLASFLKTLHSLKVDGIPSAPDSHGYFADLYNRIRQKLFPLLSIIACDELRQHFEPYLADPRHWDYPRVLTHSDFGWGNILFDAQKIEFTGVIDFNWAQYGDAAEDFASIYGFRGRNAAFAQRFFKLYPELESMMERVHFYSGTFAISEALFGIENDDQEALQSGLAPYLS